MELEKNRGVVELKIVFKRVFCVLLVLILVILSACVTFCFTEASSLYNRYLYDKYYYGVNIFKDYGVTVSDYYSKTPANFDPVKEADTGNIKNDIGRELSAARTVLLGDNNYGIFKATYTSVKRDRYKFDGMTFVAALFCFDDCELVAGTAKEGYNIKDGKITVTTVGMDYNYYSLNELLHWYYGVGFVKGEQYLIISNSSNHHIVRLGGEYPCLIMFPGAVEYDATYFGAETKYVDEDEFIDLFLTAAKEYREK